MQFGKQVVMFDLGGIPIVGNLNNGFVIGLTASGAALCRGLKHNGMVPEEAQRQDTALFECLNSNGFFDEELTPQQLSTAYLHVTQRCNLNCAGCYSLDGTRNALQDLSFSQICHSVDELAANGCSSLFISGGEPFLREDLPGIVRHAKESGIRHVTVITNGTCVRRNILERLAPYVNTIAVSFDGYSPHSPSYIRETQRFDQLVQAVRLVQETGISAHITPTIHAKNATDLKHYAELARTLGTTINYSLLSCEYKDPTLSELIPGKAELEYLGVSMATAGESIPSADTTTIDGAATVNLNAHLNCGAGAKEISIAADGTVYPCHMLHRPEWILGNILTEPLNAILRGARAKDIAAITVENIEKCSDCTHRYLCGGGCRARSLYKYDDLNHSDPYCAMMKAYFDKLAQTIVN